MNLSEQFDFTLLRRFVKSNGTEGITEVLGLTKSNCWNIEEAIQRREFIFHLFEELRIEGGGDRAMTIFNKIGENEEFSDFLADPQLPDHFNHAYGRLDGPEGENFFLILNGALGLAGARDNWKIFSFKFMSEYLKEVNFQQPRTQKEKRRRLEDMKEIFPQLWRLLKEEKIANLLKYPEGQSDAFLMEYRKNWVNFIGELTILNVKELIPESKRKIKETLRIYVVFV